MVSPDRVRRVGKSFGEDSIAAAVGCLDEPPVNILRLPIVERESAYTQR